MRVLSTSILMAIATAMGLATAGCTYRSYSAQPVGYVEVTSAPYDVSVYPQAYYEGRVVYLVDDRWMYNDRGRWLAYRQEPPYLYRQRTTIQRAPNAYPRTPPPAYGPYGPSYGPSGPQRGRPSGPAQAPPAVRVQ